MWVRLQISARCVACTETTALNAAVTTFACDGCGAALTVREELWRNALADAVAAARALDENATATLAFDAQGMSLTIAAAVVAPRCPHCDAAWGTTASPSSSCASCGVAVSVRSLGAGASGVSLVGEDTHLLAGARREAVAQTLSCTGCGAPLTVDGSARRLTCGSCHRDTVVPDETWRRVHAPTAVASWYVVTDDARAVPSGLTQRLAVRGLAAGGGRAYALATYGDTPLALLAFEPPRDGRPLAIAWMKDLSRMRLADIQAGLLDTIAWRNGELFAWHFQGRAIAVFDAATGEPKRTVHVPNAIFDATPDDDGTVLCRVRDGLQRIDAKGNAVPLWADRGFFARVFQGGAARSIETSGARLAVAHDGELRAAESFTITKLARDGALRWRADLPLSRQPAIIKPAGAADGTTWVVVRTVGGSMTVEEVQQHTEAMMAGKSQSASALLRVSADGTKVDVVRRSGPEEFNALAVTPEGEVWIADGGTLLRLDAQGELLQQVRASME